MRSGMARASQLHDALAENGGPWFVCNIMLEAGKRKTHIGFRFLQAVVNVMTMRSISDLLHDDVSTLGEPHSLC